MADTAQAVERCKRCGLLIRKPRPVCPACGADPLEIVRVSTAAPGSAPGSAPAAQAGAATMGEPAAGRRGAAAKPGLKMCPICLGSALEKDMLDYEGQKVCPECHKGLSRKAKK